MYRVAAQLITCDLGHYFVLFAGAEHMAVFLDELVTEAGMVKKDLRILDVAAGTGLVGEELRKRGFAVENVTALDYCPDMLNVARKKVKNLYQRKL